MAIQLQNGAACRAIPQYIYVDLGSRYDICKIAVKWADAIAYDFNIQFLMILFLGETLLQ